MADDADSFPARLEALETENRRLRFIVKGSDARELERVRATLKEVECKAQLDRKALASANDRLRAVSTRARELQARVDAHALQGQPGGSERRGSTDPSALAPQSAAASELGRLAAQLASTQRAHQVQTNALDVARADAASSSRASAAHACATQRALASDVRALTASIVHAFEAQRATLAGVRAALDKERQTSAQRMAEAAAARESEVAATAQLDGLRGRAADATAHARELGKQLAAARARVDELSASKPQGRMALRSAPASPHARGPAAHAGDDGARAERPGLGDATEAVARPLGAAQPVPPRPGVRAAMPQDERHVGAARHEAEALSRAQQLRAAARAALQALGAALRARLHDALGRWQQSCRVLSEERLRALLETAQRKLAAARVRAARDAADAADADAAAERERARSARRHSHEAVRKEAALRAELVAARNLANQLLAERAAADASPAAPRNSVARAGPASPSNSPQPLRSLPLPDTRTEPHAHAQPQPYQLPTSRRASRQPSAWGSDARAADAAALARKLPTRTAAAAAPRGRSDSPSAGSGEDARHESDSGCSEATARTHTPRRLSEPAPARARPGSAARRFSEAGSLDEELARRRSRIEGLMLHVDALSARTREEALAARALRLSTVLCARRALAVARALERWRAGAAARSGGAELDAQRAAALADADAAAALGAARAHAAGAAEARALRAELADADKATAHAAARAAALACALDDSRAACDTSAARADVLASEARALRLELEAARIEARAQGSRAAHMASLVSHGRQLSAALGHSLGEMTQGKCESELAAHALLGAQERRLSVATELSSKLRGSVGAKESELHRRALALQRLQLEMRESAAQGDAERQRLCSQLVLAQRARAHEQERQRSSAQEAKELRARLVGVRRQVGGALCAALYETLRARAAALRLALGRWADAARFLEPALGSSEGHLARLRAKLLEVQRGMVDGRDAAERTRAELGEQRAAADAARELARQGERAMRQSDAERRQLADELRASELRCADLEVQLHSAKAIMFASDE